MSLRDYAHFSEVCLRSNPTLTPDNCLSKRLDEADVKAPFTLTVPA